MPMKINYRVRWGKTGKPKYVSATELDAAIEALLDDGAETEEITIEVEL